MKQRLINLKALIRRGILRIFPLPRFILYLFAIVVACTLIGCATPKQVTQLVRDVRTDTIYLTSQQYDSIYIYKDRSSEYHLNYLNQSNPSPDTLYIKDKSVEYRYKLLRDTVKVIQRDSIPYEVTVTEIKEITRPLTWFDHLTRLVFWFVFGYLISTLVFKLKSIIHKP